MELKSTLVRYAKAVRILPKAFAQAPIGTINKRILDPLKRRASRSRWFVRDRMVQITDKLKGFSAGNQLFWKQSNTRPWQHVDKRLRELHEHKPDAIEDFVRISYEKCFNPSVLIALGRSALTQEIIRRCLLDEDTANTSQLANRMRRSQMVSSAIVSLASLLLDDKHSAEFARLATHSSPEISRGFLRVIDSCGFVVANTIEPDIRSRLINSGFKKATKRRLIVVPDISNVTAIAMLCQGAEEATVFAIGDLYGRANFSNDTLHSGDCVISVEHPRSRITRFSSEYHRVHEETRETAEFLVSELNIASKARLTVNDDAGTALALADNLFFPCLQFTALQQLMASEEFDHVVIGFDPSSPSKRASNDRFCDLILGINGIASDRRVELVCTSMQGSALAAFEQYTIRLSAGAPDVRMPKSRHLMLETAIKDLEKKSKAFTEKLQGWPSSDAARVLLATSQVAAYNRSSAAYCDALTTTHNLRVAFMGGNLVSFAATMEEPLSSDEIYPLPQAPHGKFELTKIWLEDFLHSKISMIHHNYIAHVLRTRIKDVATNGLLSYIAHSFLCNAWFAQLHANDQLPQLVILTPFRSPRVAALAAVSRRFNVPSFAVEPHGLNASYCRYSKITADYYGVVSSFFASAAAEGFGMSVDRCPVIGSPRLETTSHYDLPTKTAQARAALAEEYPVDFTAPKAVLSFFAQPSNWDQISGVWSKIIQATKDLDCLLILKLHPEETVARREAYMRVVNEENAFDRVEVLNGDAQLIIEASDLVLSSYSATVIEATLLRRPVFCVSNGDVDYPLNQHDVIGGQCFGSASALGEAIRDYLSDPSKYNAIPETFLSNEAQFTDGFSQHLHEAITDILALPADQSLRPPADIPKSLFLDGPHKVYEV
ncbi:hypothetical protein MWU61_16305 [Loktanella sp. F6476L]|uniref:hypothetical protein n=1 Tax=Loktanella sp. F6476L TaxID=2926405 RepID=UPI001FF552C9|nr:hypothetical protein [Loktanella sp. F6476L]MCK0122116.1 hypothetical protein [Loktanella sp. F6476L]